MTASFIFVVKNQNLNRILSEDEISQLNAAPIATAVDAAGKLSTTWASIKDAR